MQPTKLIDETFNTLDNQKVSRFHWHMVLTAGMGFFTDAYDLFVIGIVTSILVPVWHITTMQIAVLNGASLASAALGSVIFGWLSDLFGRKKLYGIEMIILFIGAILSAVSPSFIFLLISRIIVGLGIGGDYPASAVVASEHSNQKNRGFLVLLVFAMQAVGLIVGPLFSSLLMITNIPHMMIWRLLLAFGAIPAAIAFYLRRKLSETQHCLLNKELPVEVSRVVSDLIDYKDPLAMHCSVKQKLFSKKWIKCLIGTATSWFLLDIAFYGTGISSVLIINKISPHASLLRHTLISTTIFLCFAVPGYFFAARYVDRIGRKPLQMLGFFVMSFCYFGIGVIHTAQTILPLFIALFGLSFLFVNFGPNSTTFLIPSEIFPTNIRALGHGISAAIGKIGAFVGTFFLPILLKHVGLSLTMELVGLLSLMGVFTTLLVPEMKGRSLESIENNAV